MLHVVGWQTAPKIIAALQDIYQQQGTSWLRLGFVCGTRNIIVVRDNVGFARAEKNGQSDQRSVIAVL